MAQYLSLPGTAGHSATTPDHVDLRIVGDIDIRAYVRLPDWTPAIDTYFIGKYGASGNFGYRVLVETTGVLSARISANGTANSVQNDSTAATAITDNTLHWVRWTLDVDNGASGYDLKFYKGGTADTPSWVQLGTTIVGGAATSIFASTDLVRIAAIQSGTTYQMHIYRAQIRAGIDGVLVADFNAADFTLGAVGGATAVDSTGKTWTINGASSVIQDDAPAGGGHTNRLLLGVG